MRCEMRACDNPFRTERVLDVRYRLSGATWAELLGRCDRLRNRGAIIGPHGSGKTTLLESLEPRLRERGFRTHFIRLDAEHRALDARFASVLFADLTADDIVLFDGAEQMNPLAWRRFRWRVRHAAGLIVTTHQSGRLPTIWECRTSPQLLAGIAAELLQGSSASICRQAEILFTKCHGNLRDALREWYDLAAEGTETAFGT